MDLKEFKEKIKLEIVSRIDKTYFTASEEVIRQRIEVLFNNSIKKNREFSLFSRLEQQEILGQIINEMIGLGPLEELLRDDSITEIMIDGPKQVCVERSGKIERTDITFKDDEHLLYLVDKILAPLGRRLTQLEPYTDARLPDGSRVNVIRSPLSLNGTVLTIRKFNRQVLNVSELVKLTALSQEAADFLQACVKARFNILISGGTSSGKTTVLNAALSFLSPDERVITIEDTVELHLGCRYLVRLETRSPNIEGKGEVTIRDLLKNALHMRPDRVIVGEVRGEEVLDMLQAMNIGHEGSMTTIHANSPEDCLNRLETMALMGQPNLTIDLLRRQILSAVNLIIQQKRFSDGRRKMTKISELGQVKNQDKLEYQLKDIFVLDRNSEELVAADSPPSFYRILKNKLNYQNKHWDKA
ncbi:MAG: CpaF family protein [Candidatus Omnitrophica bacterium]|nr:CpaF family protein [Candidatus Omnitrophota bacterium]